MNETQKKYREYWDSLTEDEQTLNLLIHIVDPNSKLTEEERLNEITILKEKIGKQRVDEMESGDKERFKAINRGDLEFEKTHGHKNCLCGCENCDEDVKNK